MTYRVSTKQITETVAPLAEPVTLTEMKSHVRVDGSDHDTILTAMITAARQYVEKRLQKSLVQRTYRADIWDFYASILLPGLPLASITSIKYYTNDSPQVLTTLDATAYRADLGYSRIYRDSNVSIPNVANRHDAVQITYVAGYAPDSNSPIDHAANVPEAIKAAIKLQAADLYENREVNTQLRMQELRTVHALLSAYKEY